MAALTAASVQRESLGSLTLTIVRFSAVTGADTYASGLGTNVVGYWATQQANVGTTTTGIGANVLNSSGTFTFASGTAAAAVDLYIVSKS